MKLSVVILNYNVRYFLELCLDSVEKALTGIPSEIIVVDNQSTDDSCAFVKQNFPWVKLIENQENFGFSKGNNIGVSEAKGELVCLLNPDTFVAEDTFLQLLEFAAKHPDFGIIGPRLIDGSGRFLSESKRGIPYPRVAFFKLVGLNQLFSKSNYFNAYYAPFLGENEDGKVQILVGACMLIKKSNYQNIGGLDEQFFMYGEDIDLSYRFIRSGFQNFYAGKTPIVHFKGESTLKDKKYFNRFVGAMQLFYRKHFEWNLILNLLYSLGSLVLSGLKVFRGISVFKSTTDFQTIFFAGENSHKIKLVRRIFAKGQLVFLNGKELTEIPNGLNIDGTSKLIVFDTETVAFKKIIRTMIALKDSHCKFAFLSKSSTFILKSETSSGTGEVLLFPE